MTQQLVKNVDLKEITFISSASGKTIDIRSVVASFSLYEDLFKPSLTATIMVVAAVPIQEVLPFTGNDVIRLSFKSSDKQTYITVNLVAYAIENTSKIDNKYVYIVTAASPEYVLSHKKKISASYTGDYSKTVKKIFNTIASPKQIVANEPTKYTNTCIIPNWKPFEAIQYYANRSVKANSNSDEADYLFYEQINPNGNGSTFYFRTYGSLVDPRRKYTNGLTHKKVYRSFEVRAVDASNTSGFSMVKDSVEAYVINSTQNLIADLETGSLAGRTLAYDVTRKRYTKNDYDYFSTFAKKFKLDPNPNAPRQDPIPPESNLRVVSKMQDLYANEEQASDSMGGGTVSDSQSKSAAERESSALEKTIWKRLSFLQRVQRTTCTIQTPGDSNLRVGDVVVFKLPRIQSKANTVKEYDSLLQNRWLVAAINHSIDVNTGYTQSIQLIKDSTYTLLPATSLVNIITRALQSAISRFT